MRCSVPPGSFQDTRNDGRLWPCRCTLCLAGIVLGDFGFAHWVFRGKITSDIGYGH